MTVSRDRRLWVVVGAVLAGVVVGVIVSLASSASRRAEAAVLVSAKSGPSAVGPFLPNLETLATSSVVAGNIRSTLRLPDSAESLRSRLRASIRRNTQVIVISASGKTSKLAQQLAQEAAVVFSQLVGERFKTTTPQLRATILDPAHPLGGPNRHVLRNALIGALVGLIVGTVVAVLFVAAPLAPAQAPPVSIRELLRREKLLERRLGTVTARERELAARAGSLSEHERAVSKRERELEKRVAPPRVVERPPEPRPSEPVAASPEAPPTAVAEPVARPAPQRVGEWNINDIEARVDANEAADPGQQEEWRAYLFFLRDHAAADGTLPPQFDSLIDEVFGSLPSS